MIRKIKAKGIAAFGVFALFFQIATTAIATPKDSSHFSPEFGLEFRLIKYRLLNHPEPISNLALQVARVAPKNHVDAYACSYNQVECTQKELLEGKALPLQVGDILIFDKAISGRDQHIYTYQLMAAKDPRYGEGRLYIADDCLGRCRTYEVRDAAELLDIIAGNADSIPRFLQFRIARPEKYVETLQSVKIDYNATIRFHGADGEGKQYTGLALMQPVRALGAGLGGTFSLLNPLCAKKFLELRGRDHGGACGPVRKYEPLELSKESLVGLAALGFLAYVAAQTNREAEMSKRGCMEQGGLYNSNSARYECPIYDPALYLEGVCGVRYWVCPWKK